MPRRNGPRIHRVTRDVDDPRPLPAGAQEFLDHVVMRLRPIAAPAQRPDIDQIADDVERADLVFAQEIEECQSIAVARAEMQTRTPRRCAAAAACPALMTRTFLKRAGGLER